MAGPLLGFIYHIIDGLLFFILAALAVYAVLSWLIAFNVINTRNPGIYRLMDMLDRFIGPILEPLRRLIPPIGGMDISFILAWLIIEGMRDYLLRPAFENLGQLLGAQ